MSGRAGLVHIGGQTAADPRVIRRALRCVRSVVDEIGRVTMQARVYLIVGTILALVVAVGTVLLLTTHTTALPPAAPTNAAAPSAAEATVLVANSTIPQGSTISATGLHALF